MRSVAKLLSYLRPYRVYVVLSLVSLATLVVLDLAIPRLIERIIDDGIRHGDRAVVVGTTLVMLAISLSSAVIAIGNNGFSVRVGEGVARDLRAALFAHIQSYSFGNLDRQKTGHLMVRLTSDVAALKSLTQISLRIGTRAPLMMIGSLALMIHTSPALALTLLPLLVVTAVLIGFFITKMEPLFRAVQQKLDALNTVLQENIAGARIVKALVRADHENARFAAANDDMTARSVRAMQLMSSMQPALQLCINIGMVVVIWSGGLESIHGDLSLGQIVAFTNYLLTTMTPLVMMTMLSNMWAAGIASARRVDEIFSTAPEIKDAVDAQALAPNAPALIEMAGVAFAYRGDAADHNEPVLHDVDLAAAPGETVAILGATGAGKSTLVSLVPRFYDVTGGAVRFAGRDVRALTQDSIIARVAVVPQESVLFTGTVRDNIRYGRPSASDDEVVAAAQAAQAHEFISALSKGYDTHVAQRGANLSGGQKQRIAIARALLMKPSVLILDDSTSAVDVETETRIQQALDVDK
ncbi:MAG TPA: ABC transporter ATP-binding protein, partial [Myxococcota bacterium]